MIPNQIKFVALRLVLIAGDVTELWQKKSLYVLKWRFSLLAMGFQLSRLDLVQNKVYSSEGY